MHKDPQVFACLSVTDQTCFDCGRVSCQQCSLQFEIDHVKIQDDFCHQSTGVPFVCNSYYWFIQYRLQVHRKLFAQRMHCHHIRSGIETLTVFIRYVSLSSPCFTHISGSWLAFFVIFHFIVSILVRV